MKKKRFIGTIISIFIGLLVAALLKTFIVFNAVVPTGSMEPTVMAGDRLIGFKLSYVFNDPARGDIITFNDPDGSNNVFVKRIIGLPGEKITVVSGKVYINDSKTPLTETYVNPSEEPVGDFGPYIVPEDCFFVMGDNRNNSYDSRYWETTNFVKKDDILSKISFRYYPKMQAIN